ncbi:MAG: glycosyltransferase family 2 protein [bacterium]
MKLSIITINLNHADGLEKTVKSVIGQTFKDFEFIVIDGGSKDSSLDVIRAYADLITRWVSEPDTGIYNAMNKGLHLAQGEYVYFLNSGDQFYSPLVLDTIFTGAGPIEDMVYGDFMRANATEVNPADLQPDILTLFRFFRRGLCHQTIFYKRILFASLGDYDETFMIAADWDFTIRVLLADRSTRHLPVTVVNCEGAGISETQAQLSSREKDIIMKQHLPQAIYQDYRRIQFLEEECRSLKEFENWTAQIRNRNLLTNIAMVTLWFVHKWRNKFTARDHAGTK